MTSTTSAVVPRSTSRSWRPSIQRSSPLSTPARLGSKESTPQKKAARAAATTARSLGILKQSAERRRATMVARVAKATVVVAAQVDQET